MVLRSTAAILSIASIAVGETGGGGGGVGGGVAWAREGRASLPDLDEGLCANSRVSSRRRNSFTFVVDNWK